ncbi:hypothetical protein Tco_1281750 [Tanacetum coccineum]
MALPNEHQLTFSQYPDAKSMFAAIETRFGGNAATKKTQKTLLKQQYENFSATSAESLDSIFNRLQKIVSRLAILGKENCCAASPSVNAVSPQVCTTSVSDNTVYAFMVENPNGGVLQHFAKECRAPRSKEGQFRNQDNTKKQGNHEDTSSKAMLVIDGVGFDWSDMADEQVYTNMALMAFSDSELNEYEFKVANYKRGLATVEVQLITYKKNEVLFSKEVAVLKREVGCKNYEINVLKRELKKVKQEKDGIHFKIGKFDKASNDLDQFLGSQITEKSKKGLGYSAVPLPHPLIYNRPNKLDLSYSGLDEFKEHEFKGN